MMDVSQNLIAQADNYAQLFDEIALKESEITKLKEELLMKEIELERKEQTLSD